MRIRLATQADCSAMSSAYLGSWRAGYHDLLSERELDVQVEARRTKDWSLAIAQSDRVVLVAQDGTDEVVGVAECEHRPVEGRRPWLQMLYVLPNAWGTGAAVGLLGGALEAVHEAGHRSMWLEVVTRQGRARRFYEREGFVLDTTMEPGSNGLFELVYYRHDAPGP
jgi:GNAT superfamily N-acetyltransferase